jgi:hypothetical protein
VEPCVGSDKKYPDCANEIGCSGKPTVELIKSEQWDVDCTPPNPPTAWNFQVGLVTVAASSVGVAPISSPNIITVPIGGQFLTATWATPDGNDGQVQIQGTGYFTGALGNSIFSVFARASSSSITLGSGSYYQVSWDAGDGVLSLANASATIMAVSSSAFATDTWYQVIGIFLGNSIGCGVQRLTDNYWLNSSGTFQSSSVLAIQTTDSSVTGPGYSGWGGSGGVSAFPLYGDDFGLYTSETLPPGLLISGVQPKERRLSGQQRRLFN